MTFSLKLRTMEWVDRFLVGSLTAAVALLLIGLFSWQVPFSTQQQLDVGQVAPYDVVAPRQFTYDSQVLTERARARAAQSVPDQYDPPDGRVRRQQMARARELQDFITIVRADAYAGTSLQIDYLVAIPDLSITPELAELILSLTAAEWLKVTEEVPATLDRLMREEIRESGLAAARRRVPALIATDLDEASAQVVIELTHGLVRANSQFNQARTDELRDRALSDVPVQQVTLERNEIVVRAGDVTTQEHVESLTQIGLLQGEWSWWVMARALFFTLALLVVAGGILYRLRLRLLGDAREYSLLVVIVVVWALGAKFMIAPHDWLPYLYPLAALGMLVAVLLDLRVAVVAVVGFALIAHYLAPNNGPLVTYLALGGLVGAVVLGRAERLTAFLWAGVAVALCNVLTVAAFRAPYEEFTTLRLVQLQVVTLINGGLSASVAMIGYLVLGNLFGITTSLQLTELSRPTHPLLRQLLLKASGTYHHTIVVSNLAERAAAAIGADAFLARVGSYYHDIGKTVRPYFFAENIVEGVSPHDKLDPFTSAQIIISHVSDGIDLAHKYRLPPRIQDFIREHHGRSLVKYFYAQAQRAADNPTAISVADFCYPGPSPRTKETAILFLADICEAAVRAVRPASREELEGLVNRLVDERVAEGELNASNLTFRELQVIKDVFLQVLQGVHHPRVQYPEMGKKHRENSEERADGSAPDEARAKLPVPGGVEEPAGV